MARREDIHRRLQERAGGRVSSGHQRGVPSHLRLTRSFSRGLFFLTCFSVRAVLANLSLPTRRSTKTTITKVTGGTARCTARAPTGGSEPLHQLTLRLTCGSTPLITSPSSPYLQVRQWRGLRGILPGQHASRPRHAAQRQAQHLLPQRLHRPVAAGQEGWLRRLR